MPLWHIVTTKLHWNINYRSRKCLRFVSDGSTNLNIYSVESNYFLDRGSRLGCRCLDLPPLEFLGFSLSRNCWSFISRSSRGVYVTSSSDNTVISSSFINPTIKTIFNSEYIGSYPFVSHEKTTSIIYLNGKPYLGLIWNIHPALLLWLRMQFSRFGY